MADDRQYGIDYLRRKNAARRQKPQEEISEEPGFEVMGKSEKTIRNYWALGKGYLEPDTDTSENDG